MLLNFHQVRGSRAVIVFLHGGAFIMGGSASYFFGPKLVVEKDVVLVTIQHRLGALGIIILRLITVQE